MTLKSLIYLALLPTRCQEQVPFSFAASFRVRLISPARACVCASAFSFQRSKKESYTFHSVSVFNLCLIHWESMEKPDVPDGFFPMEIPSLEGCFDNEMLHLIDSQSKYQEFNSGIVYNTHRLIEGTYLDLLEKHLKEKMEDNKKHWALGPFNPVTIPERKGSYGNHICLEWLDKQARNSVIFVSFGSTTTMNDEEQIKQPAIGLKQSDQRFIWILREADKGDIFNEENERRFELPEGYEDSVNGMGLVVRDWVPNWKS
ncbi:hypothetical protein GH714_035361 [Hevea brasiliensis]|uniref:Glycosyltransferase N-terminal domain-containing protein n=1 Tax=Hevea brasiliensis TaxID=3981 RepID=A0A6A6KPJ9_HEVBR|nr:hypothetical protein GH714_035361 [Hevea brasiliensis]